jgi:hypothetical protein
MIRNLQSTVVITNCAFTDSYMEWGAAIDNDDSDVTVGNCTFERVVSQGAGPAVHNSGGTTLVSACTFLDNLTEGDGGAISLSYGTQVSVANCIFKGNKSRQGGAIASWGDLEAINCTIVDNDAEQEASGIYVGDGNATIVNTIFWHNRETIFSRSNDSRERAQLFKQAGFWAVENNIIEGLDTLAVNTNIAFDPLLVDTYGSDFSLSEYSPAINAGANAAAAGLDADQAGNARIQLGTVDIGALEAAAQSATVYLLDTPVIEEVCEGETATFSVTATNAIGNLFTWEVDDGGGWLPVGGGVTDNGGTSTLTIPEVSGTLDFYLYRFILPGVVTGAPTPLRVFTTEIIHVNGDAPPFGDGLTWASAFNNLQDALDAVQGCRKTIWITQGTYRPTTGLSASATFDIPPGAALYGGFLGTETNVSQRNWVTRPTILSGDIGTQGVGTDNSLYVVTMDGGQVEIDGNTRLDGLIVEGGRTAGAFLQYADCTIDHCTIRNNPGYGVYVLRGAPVIRRTTLRDNADSAAFIQNDEPNTGTPLFRECVFSGNDAEFDGGAVNIAYGSAQMLNSLAYDNTAVAFGGALALAPGTTGTVIHCTFSHNESLFGGGIAANGDIVIRNSILWANDTSASSDTTEEEQIAVGANDDIDFTCIQGLDQITGNSLTADGPLFVDEDGDNFRLQGCSFLVDVGEVTESGGATNDLDGLPRNVSANVDLGAYEYQGAPGSPLSIGTHPESFTYCNGDINTFAVGATGNGLTYQWQVDLGSGFSNIANDAVYSGTDTDQLALTAPPYSLNQARFRCLVLNDVSCSAYSAPATLTVRPSRLYVDDDAAPGGNGLAWTSALQHVQNALTNALLDPCGAEIWVAAGSYVPGASDGDHFRVRAHTKLYGGFAGTETNLEQRVIASNPTILEGDIGTPGVSSDNSLNVVYIDGTSDAVDADTIVDGFVVQHAKNRGIAVLSATPTLRNLVVQDNAGGGLTISSPGAPEILSCTFKSNSATFGGGVLIVTGDPNFRECVMRGNTGSTAGGGAFAQGGNPNFINCLVSGNEAGIDGGGIGLSSVGSSVILHCTIVGNEGSLNGAGVNALSVGSLTLVNSIAWHNETAGVANEDAQMKFVGTGAFVANTCIEGLFGLAGNGNFDSDPMFASDIDSLAAPTAEGDYHLQPCSPAIEAGDNGYLGGLTNDLDILSRPFNGGTADVGAYELQQSAGSPVQVTMDPQSLAYCAASTTDQFNVQASGTGLAYQWQVDRNDGLGFVAATNTAKYVGDQTTNLIITTADSSDNGTRYRCAVISSEGCIVFSQPATLTITSQRRYVKHDATGDGSGTSWTNAKTTLQSALSGIPAGQCNNEIWVAQGTYDNVVPMGMAEGTAIYGGFVGTETSLSQRDWVAHPTILNANGATNIFLNFLDEFDSYLRIGRDSRLDGFTLQNASGNAIHNYQGPSPTIANCVFRNNGHAIYDGYADPLVINCDFVGNGLAHQEGGAIMHYAGVIEIQNSTFRSNLSQFGAGIFNQFGTATIVNCLFSGNFGTNGGGGYAGTMVTIKNSTFAGNRSVNNAAGILSFSADRCHIHNSVLWSNYNVLGSYAESAQLALPGSPTNVFGSVIQNLANTQMLARGNSAADPLFAAGLDGATAPSIAGDFHLDPCSDAIDNGTNIYVVTTLDLDGLPRVSGLSVDPGVYEHQVGSIIAQQPNGATGSVADAVTFTVAATAGTNTSYAWQLSTDGGLSFSDLTDGGYYSGVTSAALTVSGATNSMTGYRYRALVAVNCDRNLSASAAFSYTNARPVAHSGITTGNEHDVISFFVFGHDPEGASITFNPATQPQYGTLTPVGCCNDHYEYQTTGYNYGVDTIMFTVNDGQLDSLPGVYTVLVNNVNELPIPNLSQTTNGFEDVPLTIHLDGSDNDGDTMTASIIGVTNGTILSVNGLDIVYLSTTNTFASDRIDYLLNDGTADAPYPGYVFITNAAVDDPPTATPDTANLYAGQSVVVPVLANDFDIETGISLLGCGNGSNGVAAVVGTNVLYTHLNTLTTRDTVTYQIIDDTGNASYGTINLFIATNFSYVVTTNADDGAGSLRQAIREANSVTQTGNFQITFSPSLAGQAILLSSIGDTQFNGSAFGLTNNVVIDGASAPLLAISCDTSAPPMRLFRVGAGTRATLRNLVLRDGYARGEDGFPGIGGGGGGGGFGGAIYSEGQLTLNKISFLSNRARGGDGGPVAGGAFEGGNGGGPNGGIASYGAGGFGGGGAGGGALGTTYDFGPPGFGGGRGGGLTGGTGTNSGGFGGGGGGGGGSSFTGGGGAGLGGAVFNRGGSVLATNCTFTGNAASGGTFGTDGNGANYDGLAGTGYGGAVFNYNGTATVLNCTFTTNTAAGGADSVYSIGDASNARVVFKQSVAVNITSSKDSSQSGLNGGSAEAVRDSFTRITANAPDLTVITNTAGAGPFAISFQLNTQALGSSTVTASCASSTLVSSVSVSGSGTNRTLLVTPVFGATGTAQVTVQHATTNRSMTETFDFTISRYLSAGVAIGHTVVIPVIQTNLGWSINGNGQGLYGTVSHTAGSLTYAHGGAPSVSDFFTFFLTDGTNVTTGTVSMAISPNAVPIADSQLIRTLPGIAIPIHFTATDGDSDPLTFGLLSLPQGALSGTLPDLVYTPPADFSGADSFSFDVHDGFELSMPATITIVVLEEVSAIVTSSADTGAGSLRQVLGQSNADTNRFWTVTFNSSLTNQEILLETVGDDRLGSSALVVSNFVEIDGGNLSLELQRALAAPEMRFFRVTSNGILVLKNITLHGGVARGGNGVNGTGGGGGGAGLGGAIFSEGLLIVENSTISSNFAWGGDGGIYDTGGNPDFMVPGGDGGGPNGGTGGNPGSGGNGGFGGGGGGSSSSADGATLAGQSGFGGGHGGEAGPTDFAHSGGNGGFGGGGGGGWTAGGGGGAAFGAGIFSYDADVILRDCNVSSNTVRGGDGHEFFFYGRGGKGMNAGSAVFIRNGRLEVSDSRFDGNYVEDDGGAIYVVGDGATGTFQMVNSVVTNTPDAFDVRVLATNNGFVGTARDNRGYGRQNAPWIAKVPDMLSPTLENPFNSSLFLISNPSNGPASYTIVATSDLPALVTNIVINGGSNLRSLTVYPVTGVYDRANITVTYTEGQVRFAETLPLSIGLFAETTFNGTNRLIQFSGNTFDYDFTIERSPSLLNPVWTNLGAPTTIDVNRLQFQDPDATNSRSYYRIRATEVP